MFHILRFSRQPLSRSSPRCISSSACRLDGGYLFKENDVVLLSKKSNPAIRYLSKPLKSGATSPLTRSTPKALYNHDDILARPVRSLIPVKRDEYRLELPSLADYVAMNDRMVTPVYGADANLIVSLLDLHVSTPRPDEPRGEALEIFEAGTGHGALTLHLARAIHGANPPPPTSIVDPTPEQREEYTRAIEEYNRNERRAVINTLDVNKEFSAVAQKSVRLFRHGMYRHNISFHVSTIPEYLEQRLEESKGAPFLDHAILDLPGVDEYIELVSRCMKPNGVLIAFCPSITQINKCALAVKEQKIPLLLESVKEIGKSAGVGGREWDVRLVRPRKLLKEEAAANELSGVAASEAATTTKDAEREASEEVADAVMAKGDAEKDAYVQKAVEKCIEAKDVEAGIRTKKVTDGEGWEFVCRPKVGEKVVGGGFIGMFRRMAEFKKEKQEEGEEQGL